MTTRIKASKKERNEAKAYIKMHLPEYLEREGINPMRNFKCLNPEHFDEHGDMSYHRRSNSCACHCGARYDTLDLIGIEYGLTSFEEIFQKGCEIFGLLGQSEDEESIKIPENWRRNIPEYKLPERASDEKCSAMYFEMTKCEETALKEEHKNDLLRRGLTEDDIKRFRFCSVPDSILKANAVAAKIVLNAAGKFDSSEGYFPSKVPGFYLGERHWKMVNNIKGYYCPVFNGEKNQILGFQIRADEPKKAKYVWFSSSDKSQGTSSGALPTILPGKDQKIWLVVEGILKALIVYCLLGKEISVIGVPGVDSIGGFKSFMEERNGSDITFFEAYDMDKYEKNEKGEFKAVKKAQERLLLSIKDAGFLSHSLSWDTKNGEWQNNYKGLDDFLKDYTKSDGNKEKFIVFLRKKRAELIREKQKAAFKDNMVVNQKKERKIA